MAIQKLREEMMDKSTPLIIGLVSLLAISAVLGAVVWHFWIGSDIPYVAISNHESAQYWGQIGDFVGGVLNPLLSFVALMAVLYSIRMQRLELALAREDARESQAIQVQQRLNFERQNFEAVFFRLLEIHTRLSNELTVNSIGASADTFVGRKAFRYVNDLIAVRPWTSAIEVKDGILSYSNEFDNRFSQDFAHYFRNFYQILKHVESYGVDPLKMNRKYPFLFGRQLIQRYSAQRIYAGMLRAQLDSAELGVLSLNCLTGKGGGLKYYVERFSMLKHLDRKLFGRFPEVGCMLFHELAFADGDEVSNSKLRDHVKYRWAEANPESGK
ncbi:putative phage abortive infection protein [Pseudomonas syringae]|uniref:putative phage abortive infection protein n=1 Tax=Pseudomonas syringae TaxID=317 RepID=UPI001F1151A7|nr:putative phage abortive infection protein [Pseudomonas syringae]MCH5508862.1 putative phage abortive infection protein [Pseudomonas syringae pv. syringae]MCH5637635.1 putative phage abortive infection protein [Pseudomonas syringae pv. syringae]MCH7426768.1 putative phage abortive infection protein [Pseudomonas syringae pv. syringae]